MMYRPAIFITGAARRVGAATALYFARNGYDIALHYHRSENEARQLQKDIEALGAACALFSHDLADTAGIAPLMDRVRVAMPHCAGLINNASVFDRAAFMETDEALFDRQWDANFKAPFFATQAFARIFGKGCIINILDTNITKTHGSHFAYLLSKKALADFTEMAARALAPAIRMNGVCPGSVLPADAPDAAYMQKRQEALPLKNHATPEAVAKAAHWLLMQEHITGQLIYVDGGEHVL